MRIFPLRQGRTRSIRHDNKWLTLLVQLLYYSIAQVHDQMITVRDLLGLRRTTRGSLGILAMAIDD